MHPSRRGIAAVTSLWILGLLPLLAISPAAAQKPTPKASATPAASADSAGIAASVSTATRPDVQIVISPDPMSGQWDFAAVYPTATDKTKALDRAKSLLSIGEWKATGLSFESSALVKGAAGAKGTVMSSVTFSTPANAVDWASGSMDLEPIIRAYKDLTHVQILYMVPAGFRFHGIRQYSDDNVDIALSGGQGAFLYVVQVKKHDFGPLNLPRTQAVPQPGESVSKRSSGKRGGASAVVVVVLAILAAAAAYFGVRRWSQTGGV